MKFLSVLVLFSFVVIFFACTKQQSVLEQTKDADVVIEQAVVETTTTSTLSL